MMIIADLVARNSRQCPEQIAFVEVKPISNSSAMCLEVPPARSRSRSSARPMPKEN